MTPSFQRSRKSIESLAVIINLLVKTKTFEIKRGMTFFVISFLLLCKFSPLSNIHSFTFKLVRKRPCYVLCYSVFITHIRGTSKSCRMVAGLCKNSAFCHLASLLRTFSFLWTPQTFFKASKHQILFCILQCTYFSVSFLILNNCLSGWTLSSDYKRVTTTNEEGYLAL